MNIAIIGPGAIGLFIAYALERAGVKATLIYRERFRKLLVEKSGGPKFKIGFNIFRLSHRLSFITAEKRKSYDIVFITTKAYDFKDAIMEAARILKDDGVAVSMQNGIGLLEQSERLIGETRSIAAILTYGATRIDIATSELKGTGNIYLGQRVGEASPLLDEVKNLLNRGGLNVEIVDDIDGYRWLKVLVNAAIGPITAIFREENKVLLQNKYANQLAISVVTEGMDVVNKQGVRLPRNPMDELFNVVRLTAGNKSSMLQDVISGKRTEIDYINGAIVEYGRLHGVPTPINETLIFIIKGLTGE